MFWRILILSIVSTTLITGCSSGSKNEGGEGPAYQVESLNSNYEYYSVNDQIFIGPQPSEENIKEFKSDKDVAVIINLRAKKENKKVNFDPKKVSQSVGIKYYQVPLMKNGQPSEASLDRIDSIMKKHGRVRTLVYCSSGNRAAAWYATQNAKKNEMTTDEALDSAHKVGLANKKLKGILTSYLSEKGITVEKAMEEPEPTMAKAETDDEAEEAAEDGVAPEGDEEGGDDYEEEPLEGLGGDDEGSEDDALGDLDIGDE